MNKQLIRILSAFLTVLFLLTSFAVLQVGAAASETDLKEEKKVNLSEIDYLKTVYRNPEEKLETMTTYASKYGYEFRINEYTGEFAFVDTATGEALFSNPYDIAASIGSDATREQVLSQIHIRFTDNTGSTKYFYSYTEAAKRKQISVEKIKGGIRVEYILGDENSRKLVPRMISANSLENLILAPASKALGTDNFWYKKLAAFYLRQDLDECTSQAEYNDTLKRYPITATMPIYVFDEEATASEINTIEDLIKANAPDYTFEQMEIDYAEVGYDSTADVSPVFKMALEYFINEDGFSVRLPANGIRFNSSLYQLESISVLPYFGCGSSANEGYTFYPDGAGTLFDFQDLNITQTTTIRNKIYGTDYAYHQISGKYQKPLRYAVFGIHEDETFYTYKTRTVTNQTDGTVKVTEEDITMGKGVKDYKTIVTDIYKDSKTELISEIESYTREKGFVAVIEEGEALTELATYHAGATSDYHTVISYFNPRPKDTYEVTSAVSVSNNNTWTVISARKYSGNFKVRYIMLHDQELAAASGKTGTLATDYNGMARAYRGYLLANEQIERLTNDQVEANIPLFIETFGALEALENILTVPVTVLKPLTTFEDIQTMYEDLNESGVKNVIFQMRGYANGGMYYTTPYKLHWEKNVGGASGFKKLLKYADQVNSSADSNIGIYPDFDFVWNKETGAGDGLNFKKHLVKTIDNRYSNHRTYSPTMQQYIKTGELAVSPAYFDHFYTKFLKKYTKYDVTGISVSTLGQTLNSDFDKKEPYNREDNKKFTKEALQYLKEQVGSVLTTGGNSYSWPYVDYVVEAPLESSGYVKSSRNVPFFGIVMHGYLQYAGAAANMEGNASGAVLRAIENGGSLFYILSYRNTEILKEDYFLSDYFSINYEIWADDVKANYNELNALMADLQTKLIINHEFLSGTRVPDEDELLADLRAEIDAAIREENEAHEKAIFDAIKAVNDARVDAIVADETLTSTTESLVADMENINSLSSKLASARSAAELKVEQAGGKLDSASVKTSLNAYKTAVVNLLKAINKLTPYKDLCLDAIAKAEAGVETIKNADGTFDGIIDEAVAHTENAKALIGTVLADYDTLVALYQSTLDDATKPTVTSTEHYEVTYFEESVILSGLSSATAAEAPVFEEEEEIFDKYLSDDGHIVAVTYGGKNGQDENRYRTFILNYNTYSVLVDYEGHLYTIPGASYAVINW